MIISFFSCSFGLADTDPVGSSVASTFETILFNESLKQIYGMVINFNPVIRDAFGIKGQDFRCQVFYGDPV